MVYFGSDDTHVYALHAADGSLAWRFKTGDTLGTQPAVAFGVVYFGSDDNHLYAVDALTGKALWQRQFTAPVNSTIAIAS